MFSLPLCYSPAEMEVSMLRSRAVFVTLAVAMTFVASLSAEEAFIQEKSTDRNFPREVTVRHGENDYLLQARSYNLIRGGP